MSEAKEALVCRQYLKAPVRLTHIEHQCAASFQRVRERKATAYVRESDLRICSVRKCGL